MAEKIFSLPTLEVKKTVKSALVTEFIFRPLTTELAITLGNTLRRLLSDQVPG
jgi:DNA-directed RNA polymerase alpha subunit